MTKALHDQRAKTLTRLGIACGAMAVGLFALSAFDGNTSSSARTGNPVFPRFANQFEDLQRVEIILPDDRYTLQRDGEAWGLAEFDNYPIRPQALAALFDGLSELTFEAQRTSDPAKYARIGVGDPEIGGLGARIRIFTGEEAPIIDTMVGRRGERDYLRFAGEDGAWLVNGDLPPFFSKSEWVDLTGPRIDEDQITRVEVELNDETYTLSRPSPDDEFTPGAGNQRLVSRFSALGPALALSRWAPIGVRREVGEILQPVSTHRTELFSGEQIQLEAVSDSGGQVWVRIVSGSVDTDGWLFQLAPQDLADLTTPRGAVLRDVVVSEPSVDP